LNLDPSDSAGASIVSYENTVLFINGNFMYLVAAFSFNAGPPFRKHLYTNIPFLLLLIAIFAFDLALLFAPGDNIVASLDWFSLLDFKFPRPPE